MPLYRLTGVYQSVDTARTWQYVNHDIAADVTAAKGLFVGFNAPYLQCCNVDTALLGLQVEDLAGGVETDFIPGALFAARVGVKANDFVPNGEGLLYQAFGGTVTKGRSEWLFRGLDNSLLLNGDAWDLGAGDVVALKGAADFYFKQFRPAASPVKAYPIVAPPAAFASSRFKGQLFMRRLGRPFVENGQSRR